MIISKSIRSTITLGVAVLALVGYNFLSAWTTPPGNPPNLNVEAPINVGGATQNKNGTLGVNILNVFGLTSITSGAPTIDLDDLTAGERGYQIHNNLNSLYFRGDRNNDGDYTGEAPWPLQLFAATTSAGDFAMFSNKVRAIEYCDRAGGNCFTAADVGGVSCQSVPYIRTIAVPYAPGGTVNCVWNDFTCMANFCVSEYGGWAGYHASALRISGNSITVFSCYDWDITSTCNVSGINNANKNDEKIPY